MLNKLSKRKEGFTIVEVLIVLAIAGVIMLVVFLAVPALQRNSRNTQRRSDVSHLSGLVNEYAANNAGILPKTVAAGALDLTSENFALMTKPTSANIYCSAGCAGVGAAGAQGAGGTFPANNTTMNIVEGFTCNGNSLVAGSPKQFAVTYLVETGGANAGSCLSG